MSGSHQWTDWTCAMFFSQKRRVSIKEERLISKSGKYLLQGRIQGEGAGGAHPTPPPPQMACGFLIQLVFCNKKKSVTPFLTGAPPPPPKKNPGSAPVLGIMFKITDATSVFQKKQVSFVHRKVTISVLSTINTEQPFSCLSTLIAEYTLKEL